MQPFIPPPNSKKIKAAEAEIYSLSVASIDQALKETGSYISHDAMQSFIKPSASLW